MFRELEHPKRALSEDLGVLSDEVLDTGAGAFAVDVEFPSW